jgi:hypothetical protein
MEMAMAFSPGGGGGSGSGSLDDPLLTTAKRLRSSSSSSSSSRDIPRRGLLARITRAIVSLMISFLDLDSSAAISCASLELHFTSVLPSSCGPALVIDRLRPVRSPRPPETGPMTRARANSGRHRALPVLFGVPFRCRSWKPNQLVIRPQLSEPAVRHLTGMVALVSNVKELTIALVEFPSPSLSPLIRSGDGDGDSRRGGLAFLSEFKSLKQLKLSLHDPDFESSLEWDWESGSGGARRTSISLDQLQPVRQWLTSLTIRTTTARRYLTPEDYHLNRGHLTGFPALSILQIDVNISYQVLAQLAETSPLLQTLRCDRIDDGIMLGVYDEPQLKDEYVRQLQLPALTSLDCHNLGYSMYSIILPNQPALRSLTVRSATVEHEFKGPLTALKELRLVCVSDDTLTLYLRPIEGPVVPVRSPPPFFHSRVAMLFPILIGGDIMCCLADPGRGSQGDFPESARQLRRHLQVSESRNTESEGGRWHHNDREIRPVHEELAPYSVAIQEAATSRTQGNQDRTYSEPPRSLAFTRPGDCRYLRLAVCYRFPTR